MVGHRHVKRDRLRSWLVGLKGLDQLQVMQVDRDKIVIVLVAASGAILSRLVVDEGLPHGFTGAVAVGCIGGRVSVYEGAVGGIAVCWVLVVVEVRNLREAQQRCVRDESIGRLQRDRHDHRLADADETTRVRGNDSPRVQWIAVVPREREGILRGRRFVHCAAPVEGGVEWQPHRLVDVVGDLEARHRRTLVGHGGQHRDRTLSGERQSNRVEHLGQGLVEREDETSVVADVALAVGKRFGHHRQRVWVDVGIGVVVARGGVLGRRRKVVNRYAIGKVGNRRRIDRDRVALARDDAVIGSHFPPPIGIGRHHDGLAKRAAADGDGCALERKLIGILNAVLVEIEPDVITQRERWLGEGAGRNLGRGHHEAVATKTWSATKPDVLRVVGLKEVGIRLDELIHGEATGGCIDERFADGLERGLRIEIRDSGQRSPLGERVGARTNGHVGWVVGKVRRSAVHRPRNIRKPSRR